MIETVEKLLIISMIVLFTITALCIGYIIGYVAGFKKSKQIDDKIIDDMMNGDK